MPGRWNDERERDWRGESDWRDRDRTFEGREDRWRGGEQRSFGRGERVFGERDTGAEYNRQRGDDWQPRYYGSDAARFNAPGREYERGYGGARFQNQDYTRGGRFYGDDAREPIYREEYGQGGYEYGDVPRGYDEGRRFGTREADQRYAREMRRMPSGGTGGYDYERGYGDAGRSERRRDFEDRAHDAGEFFRRTGQRISSWFSDVRSDMNYRDDERRYEAYRGARGLGPRGYKRSDERIDDEVHQRLTDDPWLDATEITASVSGGEVTLAGSVETRESKHRAERIVEDISGVTHVQNNLRIKPGNYFTTAGRGYGDSVQEARMASSEPATGVTDGETSSPTRKN